MARARYQGRQIGVTLGTDETSAGQQLCRLLTQLDDGTVIPRSESNRRRIKQVPPARLDLRTLVGGFLAEKRRTKGRKTTNDYTNRLAHILDFAELPKSRKAWRLASDINREFAIELRSHLFATNITRNGRDGGHLKKMSLKMVRICLETLRAALNWARRADVRKLPVDIANPITEEIIGPKLGKDPLRPNPVPLAARIAMVERMDAWQLLTLAAPLVLPLRFEDVSGAMVSDFDFARNSWRIGDRLAGNDVNKSRVTVHMPLAASLARLLRISVNGRPDGPMFLSRRVSSGQEKPRLKFDCREKCVREFEAKLRRARAGDVETEQDRKEVFRRMLVDCGAVTTDAVSQELKTLMVDAGIPADTAPYQIRSATTTEMNAAGIGHLVHTYLTEHSVGHILNEYTSLDPQREMAKYFLCVRPLLEAIDQRARELGLLSYQPDSPCPENCLEVNVVSSS